MPLSAGKFAGDLQETLRSLLNKPAAIGHVRPRPFLIEALANIGAGPSGLGIVLLCCHRQPDIWLWQAGRRVQGLLLYADKAYYGILRS